MFKIRELRSPNNETRVTLFPVRAKRVAISDIYESAPTPSPSEVLPSGERSPLVFRSEFRTVCNAHSYARTKFGLNARRRLMRAGGAMDRLDPNPNNYVFLTATLPGDDEWSKWAIAEDSHHIIDGLKSWLSKRIDDRLEFYVWEHQKRSALHLHYCVYVPDSTIRKGIIRDFRDEWIRLLDGTHKRTGVNVWGKHSEKTAADKYALIRTDAQEVYFSVAAYLAGYCGGKKDKHRGDEYRAYYPRRWFGVSRPLSALIDSLSEERTKEYPNYRIAKLVFDQKRHENEASALTARHYKAKFGRGETSVTYHTPQEQVLLWQEQEKMQYKKSSHPNIWFFIQALRAIALMHSELMEGSQLYRTICSKQSVNQLQDSLSQDSMLRGILRDVWVQQAENLFFALDSQSSLPPTLQKHCNDAMRFCRMYSQNYPKVRWNKYGYLISDQDFDDVVFQPPTGTVDKLDKIGQVSTNPDEGDGVGGTVRDSSRGHVPSEDKTCPHFLTSHSHTLSSRSLPQLSLLPLMSFHTQHSLH